MLQPARSTKAAATGSGGVWPEHDFRWYAPSDTLRPADFRAASDAAGLAQTPKDYTWHHHQDGETMQLVSTDIHSKTGHTGGVALGGGV